MPFQRQRPKLELSKEPRNKLESAAGSRTEQAGHVERVKMLPAYADGDSVSLIARVVSINRPKVERYIDKALQVGGLAALKDLPQPGKKIRISQETKAWFVSLACQNRKDLGYSLEPWATRLLANYLQKHCNEAGYPGLEKISRGTVAKFLLKNNIRPYKIKFYLERGDEESDTKMTQLLQESDADYSPKVAILSYEEKPGIQAIGNTALDLPWATSGDRRRSRIRALRDDQFARRYRPVYRPSPWHRYRPLS